MNLADQDLIEMTEARLQKKAFAVILHCGCIHLVKDGPPGFLGQPLKQRCPVRHVVIGTSQIQSVQVLQFKEQVP